MEKTKIQWTDSTWSPYRGTKGMWFCTKVSPGCRACYAESMNLRGLRGSKVPFRAHADRIRIDESVMDVPIKWQRARKIFVNSMSDTFHETVEDHHIARVFAVMAVASHHTYQVLTKRSERMRDLLNSQEFWSKVEGSALVMSNEKLFKKKTRELFDAAVVSFSIPNKMLPNVHLGVSVENQEYADLRIPHLLTTPAAARFISAEPLLGPVDLRHLDADRAGHEELCQVDALTGRHTDMGRPCPTVPAKIDQVIIGGESGGKARPFDIAWARAIVEQCKEAGVQAFVKQLGAQPRDGLKRLRLADPKGGNMDEWPEDLRIRGMIDSSEVRE